MKKADKTSALCYDQDMKSHRLWLIVFLLLTAAAFGRLSAAAEPLPDGDPLPEEEILETEEDFDPAAQLQAYLDRNLLGTGDAAGTAVLLKKSAAYNGSRLTGLNREVYDAVKPLIAEVAAGERSSTSFTVTIDIPDKFAGKSWTAEDLGLESLVTASGAASSAYHAPMEALTGYSRKKVVYALLRDCPYEMYWFGRYYKNGYPWAVYRSGDSYVVRLKTAVTLDISVYQADREDDPGFADTETAAVSGKYYAVDPAKITEVNTAIENARAIAAGAAANEALNTDRALLTHYFTTIHGLSAYNSAAANTENMYGNPWQLIWLFDGDPDTKVVCEGYAKGFQYLCDMTDFDSEKIRCISVTGYMNGSSALHMWNVVRLEDGQNYLVDATNPYKAGGVIDTAYFCLAPAVSGDLDGGYSVQNGPSARRRYTYDDDTRMLYSDAALTLADPVLPPAKVKNFAAAVTEGVDGVRLTWDALDGAEGYHIYKKMGSGSYSAEPAAVLEDPLSAEWTDTDIAEVADFSYRIKAWVTDPQTQEKLESEVANVVSVHVGARPVALSDTDIRVADQTYTGTAQTPAPVILWQGLTLTEGTDYTVDGYAGNINAGKAAVTITGIPKDDPDQTTYTGTVTVSFTVKPVTLASATIKYPSLVYTGKTRTQSGTTVVTATVAGQEKVLTWKTDYTISYKNSLNAGTATMTIMGKGNYTGTLTKTFTITKRAQTLTAAAASAKLQPGKTTQITAKNTTYTGVTGTFSYTSSDTAVATVNSKGLVTAKAPGKAVITVKVTTPNYKDASVKITVKVVPKATASVKLSKTSTGIKVTWQKVAGADGYYIYRNGKKYSVIKSGSTVSWLNTSVRTGVKYTYYVVAYDSASGAGAASAKKTTWFVPRPAAPVLTGTRAGRLTVSWDPVKTADGYRIQVSTAKDFSENTTNRTVYSDQDLKKTVASLKSGTRYYVRVRAFVEKDGKQYISAWSPVRYRTVR